MNIDKILKKIYCLNSLTKVKDNYKEITIILNNGNKIDLRRYLKDNSDILYILFTDKFYGFITIIINNKYKSILFKITNDRSSPETKTLLLNIFKKLKYKYTKYYPVCNNCIHEKTCNFKYDNVNKFLLKVLINNTLCNSYYPKETILKDA